VHRLPFQRLIRPRGYAPVGHLGVEPSYTALSERPLRPDGPWPMNLARRRGGRYALPVAPPFEAGSATHPRRTLTCQERKMRVSSPTAARTVAGVQSPLPRRRRTFHGGERRTRTVTLARSFAFEATPAALAGSLSTSALPPDANGREMAEDGAVEARGVTRRPVSGRGRPPGRFILRGEWVTRTPRRLPRSR
jgi:hypothetical protein